tara:strand:+ start:34049 stop:34186 length:138 start_codon:yes stop_codon:yes gene_type:complete
MKIKPQTAVHKAIERMCEGNYKLKMSELEEIVNQVVTVELALNFL